MGASTHHPSGKLVLIIGPSGVGKSAILKRLRVLHPEFHFPRSATTRPRRVGEGDELYHFLTDAAFDVLESEGKFLESATVHGGGRYATMIEEIIPQIEAGKVVVREVDVQGFDSISHHPLFGDEKLHPLQSIFILPESKEQLIERIRNRAPISEEELQRRIASMEQELSYATRCSHRIVNREGALEETIQEVEQIICA